MSERRNPLEFTREDRQELIRKLWNREGCDELLQKEVDSRKVAVETGMMCAEIFKEMMNLVKVSGLGMNYWAQFLRELSGNPYSKVEFFRGFGYNMSHKIPKTKEEKS